MPAAPAPQKVAQRAAIPAVQRSHRQAATAPVTTPARPGSVQRAGALRVSSPSDPAEREAERTAQRVVSIPEPADFSAPPAEPAPGPQAWRSPYVARFAGTIARRAPMVARKAEGEPVVTDALAADIAASRGGGAPLPPSVRRFMEPRFGANFDAVRVHTGDRAAALSRGVSARAFTVGDQVFFGKDQFQPESGEGRTLIAHELTHTIQQGAVLQRSIDEGAYTHATAPVSESSLPQVQRAEGEGGLITGKINALAYNIQGFRMFTIVLGMNPITGAGVDRSPANILRAIVEFLPGGHLIVDALDKYGIFDKVGGWVAQQIASLGMVGSSFGNALTDFLKKTSALDLLDPSGLWQKAKRIFTEPVDRLIAFIKNLGSSILGFIRDAILTPLSILAKDTRGYDLLCVVLGKDPITDQPVPPTADNLIGGFMKFIGQEEVWTNAKNAHAGDRLLAWFKQSMTVLKGFVQQIPTLFINALKSLEVVDLIPPPRALLKVAGAFGDFAGKFLSWGLNAVWNLLEIVFDVVSPGALTYLKKTGEALKSILKNPLPFVGNLVKAAKLGLQNFAGNFLNHLKAGLIDWLTGSLQGVYIPTALSLVEIGKFVLSVLGISWANIRAKFVKAIGAAGEVIMTGLEKTFDVMVALATGGPAAAWEKIKEYLTDLKDMAIGFITDFVVDAVVKKAIPKLVAMFIPGAGFVSAIISIYDTIMVFVQKLSKIAAVVKGFVDSIVAIANGVIGAAAARVENTLAGLLSLAISFLAGFIGLGNVASKINGLIAQVRGKVDKALDTAVTWIVAKAKSLFAKLFKKKDKGKQDEGEGAASKPFSLPEEGHTLSGKVHAGKLVVRISSNRELEILAMLAEAMDQVSKSDRDEKTKATVMGDLIGARAMVQEMYNDFSKATQNKETTQEWDLWMDVRLTQIINILKHLGADGIKAFRDFLGKPLERRYLPAGYDVRNQIYLRGSGWPGNRASIISAGIAARDQDVDLVIANRTINPPVANDAWNRLVTSLRAPRGATQSSLTRQLIASTNYEVDHIDVLSLHWNGGGYNSPSDQDRWALSNVGRLRYITEQHNQSRPRGKFFLWVGKTFQSQYADGGIVNAKRIDGQPFLDAPGGNPI